MFEYAFSSSSERELVATGNFLVQRVKSIPLLLRLLSEGGPLPRLIPITFASIAREVICGNLLRIVAFRDSDYHIHLRAGQGSMLQNSFRGTVIGYLQSSKVHGYPSSAAAA